MNGRRGFTLIETMIVIALGMILTSIAISSFANVQQSTSMSQSKQMLWAMHAHTRAQAIESGQNVELRIHGPGDSVNVARNDTILESYYFEEDLGVDISVSGSSVTLCMGPNGVADLSCNSFSSLVSGQFTSNAGESFYFYIFPGGGLVEQS